MPTSKIVLLTVMALVGPLFLILGGWQWRVTKSFVRNAWRTRGVYVGAQAQSSLTTSGAASHYRQVEFSANDGQIVRFSGRVGAVYGQSSVGQPVDVLYDPANPPNAHINTFAELWLVSLILLAVGAGLLGVAALVWWLG